MAENSLSQVASIVQQTRKNPQLLHQIVFGDEQRENGIPAEWKGASPEYAVGVLLGYDG